MRVQLHRVERKASETLHALAAELPPDRISLRELLERLGDQGLLLFCAFLALPFLFPITIPGTSMPFGFMVVLIGIGVALDRIPWLPRWLMERRVASATLAPVLRRGGDLFKRIERWVHPRLAVMSNSTLAMRLNGIVLCVGGVLLLLPIPPIVPLTNTVPAWGILILAAGLLQRDGYFVLAGWAIAAATIVYFSVLIVLAVTAGKGVLSYFGMGA